MEVAVSRYADTLRALYARARGGPRLELDCIRALLLALGSPERRLRHVVVGGTNGKGSVSWLLAEGLRAGGHSVGHYTSPHLLRFTERIQTRGLELSPERAVELAERVLAHEAGCPRPPTFFELVTAMALLAFAEDRLELAVLEVGLGGRLDATNAVDKLLSVITRVGLDHQSFLGDTVQAIAREKAGIMQPGGTVVLGAQVPEVDEVLSAEAARHGTRVVRATPTSAGGSRPGFLRENLATALAAGRQLERLGLRCPEGALLAAGERFAWPGRYQYFAAGAPRRVPFLIDGAHNPDGVQALAAALQADARLAGKPRHMVGTVLADRPGDLLAPLTAGARSLHLCPVGSARSRTPAELSAIQPGASVHPDAGAALAAAETRALDDGGFVLVAGSLLLVADALTALTGERRDPPVDG